MSKKLLAKEMNKCIGCFTCMTVCAASNHHSHSLQKSAIRIMSSGGISSGKMIARVCLSCTDERSCAEACPTGALVKRPGGGVVLRGELCIGCGHCEQACIVSAITMDPEEKKPIVCRQCGLCARYCPHGCLKMEEIVNAL